MSAPPVAEVGGAFAEPTENPGRRWVAGMCLLNAGVMIGFFVPIQVLLAQQSQAISPHHKELLLAWTSAAGALSSTILNPVWGLLSDRTTSRRGRRWPWVAGGTLASAAALLLLSGAGSIAALVAGWILAQATLNAILAPIVAAVPDQVPVPQRGIVGGLISMAQTVGVALGSAIPMLTGSVRLGYLVVVVLVVLSAVPYLLHSRDHVVTAEQLAEVRAREHARVELTLNTELRADFRWAFVTRFLMQFGNALMLLFMYYFLKDGLHLGKKGATSGVFELTALYAVATVLAAVAGGIASDRFQRRRPFVIWSGLVVAAAFVMLMFVHTLAMTLVAALVMGLGFGMYQAVDFALITQVLPEAEGRGRDMGILNIASALPQVVAPLISIALIVGYGVSYPLLFGAAALVSVLGSVLVLKIRTVA